MTTETDRKGRDYVLRLEESKLRLDESKLRLEESKLQEWHILRDSIKKLRHELVQCDSTDLTEKHELEFDIECLVVRKAVCAKILGMHQA